MTDPEPRIPALRPTPQIKQKDVMQIARCFMDKQDLGTFGKHEEKLLQQMRSVEGQLRMQDMKWALLAPEDRTAKVWQGCMSNWTDADVDNLVASTVVPVLPFLNIQVTNFMWGMFEHMVPSHILAGWAGQGEGEAVEAHVIWAEVKEIAEEQKVAQLALANVKLQQLDPIADDAKLVKYDEVRDQIKILYDQRRLSGMGVEETELIVKYKSLLGAIPMMWARSASATGKGATSFSAWYANFRQSVGQNDINQSVRDRATSRKIGGINQVNGADENDNRRKKWAEKNKECLEKGLCFGCKEPGHVKRNCPLNDKSTGDAAELDARKGIGANKGGKTRMVKYGKTQSMEQELVMDSAACNHLMSFPPNESELDSDGAAMFSGFEGSELRSEGIGEYSLKIETQNKEPLTLRLIGHYAPRVGTNIVSTARLARSLEDDVQVMQDFTNKTITFETKMARYIVPYEEREMQAIVRLQGNGKTANPIYSIQQRFVEGDFQYFHRLFGHLSRDLVVRTAKASNRLRLVGPHELSCDCEVCILSNGRKTSRNGKLHDVRDPSTVWSVDTVIISPEGVNGKRVAQVYVSRNRYGVVHPLRRRSEATESLREVLTKHPEIRVMISDNAKEFRSESFASVLREFKVQHYRSPAYDPAANGLCEKMHVVYTEMATRMLKDAGLKQRYWPYALTYAADVYNRMYCKAVEGFPYELTHGVHPSYENVVPFGSVVHELIPWQVAQKAAKFRSKTRARVFVGLDPEHTDGTARLLDMELNPVTSSRELTHVAKKTSLATMIDSALLIDPQADVPDLMTNSENEFEGDDDEDEDGVAGIIGWDDWDDRSDESEGDSGTGDAVSSSGTGGERQDSVDSHDVSAVDTSGYNGATDGDLQDGTEGTNGETEVESQVRQVPDRVRFANEFDQLPANVQGQHMDPSTDIRNSNEYQDRARQTADRRSRKSGVLKVNSKKHDGVSPKSIAEALASDQRDEWISSLSDETKKVLNVCEFVRRSDLPPGQKTVPSMFVLKVKRAEPPLYVTKLKARLVLDGSRERNTVMEDVYAPTAANSSIHVTIDHAVHNGYELRSFDVANAFLNSETIEGHDTYMEFPRGFPKIASRIDIDMPKEVVENLSQYVLKLNTQLYGSVLAPKAWGLTFSKEKVNNGYKPSTYDGTMHVKRANSSTSVVTTHVDDSLVSASKEDFDGLVEGLSQRFKLHSINHAEVFLGVQSDKLDDGGYALHHGDYIASMLRKYELESIRKVAVPSAKGQTLGLPEHEQDANKEFQTEFRSKLGAVAHIQRHTRPELSPAINALSRRAHNPNEVDMRALHRVFGYLAATPELPVMEFHPPKKGESNQLHVFVDASLMNVQPDIKSTMGYLVYHGTNLISYGSKSTAGHPDSSYLAETLAMLRGFREAIYVYDMLKSLLIDVDLPIVIYSDNRAACINVLRGSLVNGSKHTLARTRELRSMIEQGLVVIKYQPTEHQLADVLTKPLSAGQFQYLRSMLKDPTALLIFSSEVI
jgi:transposase InsO family protein